MTDQTTPAAGIENVGRGTLFALVTIPVAIALFAIVAGVFNLIVGIAAVVVPSIASWLYTKGAGTPPTRAAWTPFIVINAIAIVLGIAAGFVAGTYAGFQRVGGDGGIFAPAFATTLHNQFTNGFENILLPLIVGLVVGAAAIAGVLRGQRLNGRSQPASNGLTPHQTETLAGDAGPTAASTPTAPSAPSAPLANEPSPGIMLNGKPLDPKKK